MRASIHPVNQKGVGANFGRDPGSQPNERRSQSLTQANDLLEARKSYAVLHRALEQAVRFSLIPFNPAARVDPPKVRQEEITPLDSGQARVFLEAA